MSGYNIPIIEPTIDYTKVPPINQKRTIAFINHFIAHTVIFLNKFSLSCEERFFEFEDKLQKIEAALEILEQRFSSIPHVDTKLETEDNVIENESKSEQVKQAEAAVPEIVESDKVIRIEQTVEKSETQPVSSDPQYEKYFKMIHFGVPKQAVKLSMEQEGLDSRILDNPNQLVPKTKPDINPDVNANG
ncbi:PREDICTED: WASH complex subunit CCDC53 homolog [Ceratosolen solmsi marchali]|uniref:WASH complex subunit CCDC53 homolog n=1 Tax=Ceratosolen solmsi marchali TaxID=326594 RepID=A0AAJ6YE79_9HYME|nr:PREDICTED: WASH complex subunit CCDC53 homolog [Ceratosolen solmsi marchali]